MEEEHLTHVDRTGAAQMVDVGGKAVTRRTAVAEAVCRMNQAAADAIRHNNHRKGDVLQVARIAAISGAKRTDELIPLCHSVPMDQLATEFEWLDRCTLRIEVVAVATGKTGVEMEAMMGASLAALTIYDMCKAMDRSIRIEQVSLCSKTGGSRGDYVRDSKPAH